MRMDTKTFIYLEDEDYLYIRVKMKEQKLTIKALCEEMMCSRSQFDRMINGKICANQLVVALSYHFIYPKYEWAHDYSHKILGD